MIQMEITRKQYNDALDVVEAYHRQIFDMAKISPVPKNKFKDFDKLEFGDSVECVSLYSTVTELTVGKSYEVVDLRGEKFWIINDKGVKRSYRFYNSMFKPLS